VYKIDVAHTIELSPNQIVAFNIEKLRRERGWSAQGTANRLGSILGRKISLASYSAMERSIDGKRIKHFDADEIFAFARVFGVRVWTLFVPPINYHFARVKVRPQGAPARQSLARNLALALIAEMPEDDFAEIASIVRGVRRKPLSTAAEPLDLKNPVTAAAMKFLQQAATRPPAGSALEEERDRYEFYLFMREIDQARHEQDPVNVGPTERRSSEERNREAVAGVYPDTNIGSSKKRKQRRNR
jgi:hypothetical protein